MIRAVIFDMGGTLMRFVRPGNGTWRELEDPGIRGIYRYLIEQGHPIGSQEDAFVEAMFARLAAGWEQATGGQINLRAVDWIAAGAAEHSLTLDEAALIEAARMYARPMRAGVSATPGAAATLAALHERGHRIGLISNTIWPAELHLEDLEEIGLLHYIERPIFSGELGIWKPSPQIFQHALDVLGATPAETVFVGDSPREDILGAQRVGMRAVWVRSREFPLGDVQPDGIIEALPELLPILDRWIA
ncbi:MAG: HAD family hydrolase [Kouleothrix sp.]|nr:HAD family hydrolase [Kouleothrix sp.]